MKQVKKLSLQSLGLALPACQLVFLLLNSQSHNIFYIFNQLFKLSTVVVKLLDPFEINGE